MGEQSEGQPRYQGEGSVCFLEQCQGRKALWRNTLIWGECRALVLWGGWEKERFSFGPIAFCRECLLESPAAMFSRD